MWFFIFFWYLFFYSFKLLYFYIIQRNFFKFTSYFDVFFVRIYVDARNSANYSVSQFVNFVEFCFLLNKKLSVVY
jgi:hypothetical protein